MHDAVWQEPETLEEHSDGYIFQVLSVIPLAEHHPSMGFALLVAVAAVPNGRPKTGAARGRQYQPTFVVIVSLMIFLSRVLELVPLRLNRRDQPMLAQQMCQPPVIPLPSVEFDPSTHPIFRPAPHVVFLEEWLAFLARLDEPAVWRRLRLNDVIAARGQRAAASGQHHCARTMNKKHFNPLAASGRRRARARLTPRLIRGIDAHFA